MQNLTVENIKTVGIIGCGTMGLRIALRCAIDGYTVKMYDINQDLLDKAVHVQGKLLKSLVRNGAITEGGAAEAQKRIETTIDPAYLCKNTDLISESVTEDYDIKQKVYTNFAAFFEKHTIVTTNTSYLLPSMFAEASGCPERFCAFHFHDVFVANVVDVMPHPDTAAWVCDVLMAFGEKIQQIPVYVKQETSGYIFNAMLLSLIGAAGYLASNDLASVEDIDRSWIGNMKTPLGPFGMLDQVGLDTAWHIVNARRDPRSMRFAAFLKEKIDAGKLGVKTGEGFYKY